MAKDKQMDALLNSARGTDVERIIEAIDRNTAAQERIAAALEKIAVLLASTPPPN